MNTASGLIEPALPDEPPRRATVADLYQTKKKAELIGGKIVRDMAIGLRHNRVATKLYRLLDDYAKAAGQGEAVTDNLGFVVPALRSGRESFSPDASYYLGPFPDDEEEFIAGPPTLAAEVRSPSDYGPQPERDAAGKRRDYFEAGTLVVWDVDPRSETVAVYRRDEPERATVYRRGDVAEAEPAAPGWRLAVDEVFA